MLYHSNILSMLLMCTDCEVQGPGADQGLFNGVWVGVKISELDRIDPIVTLSIRTEKSEQTT